jgi:hypothetical protein
VRANRRDIYQYPCTSCAHVGWKSGSPANVAACTTPSARDGHVGVCACAGIIYGGYYNGNEARRECSPRIPRRGSSTLWPLPRYNIPALPLSCRPQRVNTSRGRASSGRNGASRGNLLAVPLDSRYMSETSKGDELFAGSDKGEKRSPWRMSRVGEWEVYLCTRDLRRTFENDSTPGVT